MRCPRRVAAVMLADHPHVQGLLLGVSLLAAAAMAAPAAWHAVRDLGEIPQRVVQPTIADPVTGPESPGFVVVSSEPTG